MKLKQKEIYIYFTADPTEKAPAKPETIGGSEMELCRLSPTCIILSPRHPISPSPPCVPSSPRHPINPLTLPPPPPLLSVHNSKYSQSPQCTPTKSLPVIPPLSSLPMPNIFPSKATLSPLLLGRFISASPSRGGPVTPISPQYLVTSPQVAQHHVGSPIIPCSPQHHVASPIIPCSLQHYVGCPIVPSSSPTMQNLSNSSVIISPQIPLGRPVNSPIQTLGALSPHMVCVPTFPHASNSFPTSPLPLLWQQMPPQFPANYGQTHTSFSGSVGSQNKVGANISTVQKVLFKESSQKSSQINPHTFEAKENNISGAVNNPGHSDLHDSTMTLTSTNGVTLTSNKDISNCGMFPNGEGDIASGDGLCVKEIPLSYDQGNLYLTSEIISIKGI